MGDYVLGTRVVDERPGREAREADLDERAEIAALTSEIKELVPGSAAAPTSPAAAPAPWFASVKQEVVGKDVIGSPIRPDTPATSPEDTKAADAESTGKTR